ncbi:hypothetical protein BpHYR1_046836 [Brachionus plicatilis]|uniref:Uncharacterized protein n=1 Tax=Brachionus plicatilis TaxID=10195 RepID=A0A3M7S0C2_BRAPC|nr:hypothetical protein BpHYR1_046836 [Brachionus plicatilis]
MYKAGLDVVENKTNVWNIQNGDHCNKNKKMIARTNPMALRRILFTNFPLVLIDTFFPFLHPISRLKFMAGNDLDNFNFDSSTTLLNMTGRFFNLNAWRLPSPNTTFFWLDPLNFLFHLGKVKANENSQMVTQYRMMTNSLNLLLNESSIFFLSVTSRNLSTLSAATVKMPTMTPLNSVNKNILHPYRPRDWR